MHVTLTQQNHQPGWCILKLSYRNTYFPPLCLYNTLDTWQIPCHPCAPGAFRLTPMQQISSRLPVTGLAARTKGSHPRRCAGFPSCCRLCSQRKEPDISKTWLGSLAGDSQYTNRARWEDSASVHQHAYREATGGQGCITTILFSIFFEKLMTDVSLSEAPGPVVGVRNALSALARQRI